MIQIPINTSTLEGYNTFIKCKSLPVYSISDHCVWTDEESYKKVFTPESVSVSTISNNRLFDYQLAIINRAISEKRIAAFLDCGLGKTAIALFFAKAIAEKGKVLLLCPLSVINEFKNDAKKFDIDTPITNLRESGLEWDEGIGILNYESIKHINLNGVSGIILDESSILKNGDGKTKKWLCDIARTIEYRLALSATPAPNDQSEYASHAVFLGIANTNKEFYSRFFRKDGNSWILKPHATSPFYEHLNSWACYIHNPSLLGYESGGYLSDQPEYIEVLCNGGDSLISGSLFANAADLSSARKIYKYRCEVGTDRFNSVVDSANKYKSIVWCNRNEEEKNFHRAIKGSALITGQTPHEKRVEIIESFRRGDVSVIISKPSILGWGVNLQQADAHIYSGYDFSFESFYQAIRRSHRFGRNGRLKVFIPMIRAERPIYDTIKRKMKTFEQDVASLQSMFSM